ncbi:kelch motif protein (macronuclear) [Tetrahymena thermophila SB210]|uniref:Kelch motif protein n=1 Tax=Tetrahymena thermophila (strain SB210) TaxID=312017 RepID=Q23G54_TETTS|nr:kelch motif protein [Tetrahymena thermophila SB210]EAR95406.2 kelch motif protein [Tetrahymena thermophila SB210]|eukprot:XP_001015651.2 kelch motif protein [Tetrahymena thermophila SB210]
MKQLSKYSLANMSQLSQHHLKQSETDNWSQLRLPSGSLNSRSYHSISYYHNKIYIYGGYELHTGVKDDFLYFDYSSETLGTPMKVNAQNPQLSPGIKQFEIQIKINYFNKSTLDNSKEYSYQILEVQLFLFKAQFYSQNYKQGSFRKEINNFLKIGPLCRHTANQFKDNLIIYGGKQNAMQSSNLICVFDFIEEKWLRKNPTVENANKNEINQVPYLESHSSSIDEKTGRMYIFGGFEHKKGHLNKLYEFDIYQNSWKIIQSSQGKVPSSRSSHSSAFINGNLYIFGGQNLNQRFGDLWCFSVQNNAWSEIITPNQPQPRSGHSMCKYQNNIILFGGILGITREINDLFCFSTEKQEWSCLEYETKYDRSDFAHEDFLNQLSSEDSHNNTMIQNKQTPKTKAQILNEDFSILGEFGLSMNSHQQTPKIRKQYSEKHLINRKEDKNEFSHYLNRKQLNTHSMSVSRQQQVFEENTNRQNIELFECSQNSQKSKQLYKKSPSQLPSERLYKIQQIRKMFNHQYLYSNNSEFNENSIYDFSKSISQGHTPVSQSVNDNILALKLDSKFFFNKVQSEETPKHLERDQSYEKSNYTSLINNSIQQLGAVGKEQEYQLNFQSFAKRFKTQSTQLLHKGQIQESLNAIFDKIKRLSMNPLISKQEKYQQIIELRKKILLREFVDQNTTKKIRATTDHANPPVSQSQQNSQKYINTEQNDGKQQYHQAKLIDGSAQNQLPRIKSPTTDAMRKAIQMTESKAKGAENFLEQKFIQFNNSQMLQQIKQVKIENSRIKNIKPQPRDGHSAIVIDDFLIILGGDRHKLSFNDIFECNLRKALNNYQGQLTSPRDRKTNQKIELGISDFKHQYQISQLNQIHS